MREVKEVGERVRKMGGGAGVVVLVVAVVVVGWWRGWRDGVDEVEYGEEEEVLFGVDVGFVNFVDMSSDGYQRGQLMSGKC